MKQFLTIKEASKEFSRCEQTIYSMVTGIRSHPERYDETNFFGKGKKILIRAACLIDYDKYGEQLEKYPDTVSEYVPTRIESNLGIGGGAYPTAHEIATEVAAILRR